MRDPVDPGLPNPPALHPRYSDIRWIAGVGTAAWFLASIGLLIAHLVAGRPLDEWFTTSVAGWILGLLGFGVMGWQRAARRRGSRGAQDTS